MRTSARSALTSSTIRLRRSGIGALVLVFVLVQAGCRASLLAAWAQSLLSA
ncbi:MULTISPECIES: hypothetical protein [Burkholderia]|uniref:hypothetical protein n=1 Tax=Burkholderia TaxID=32008 RepID=UPI0015892F58|nr:MULTISPECIES: hypothetical protein [Burkholderia]MCU9956609.1 hypothetical protein [Burkholderia sp. BKH01]